MAQAFSCFGLFDRTTRTQGQILNFTESYGCARGTFVIKYEIMVNYAYLDRDSAIEREAFKMREAAVSVIVPVYNVAPWLEACLNSLEKQTLKNIEVILVNDGSTDGSGEIARRYAERNSNFILIERENLGVSAARNAGLDKATGEYVYFLDSDDYLMEDTLERIYTKASSEQLDVVVFSAYSFQDPDGELTWSSDFGYRYRGTYPEICRDMDVLRISLDNNDYFASCCLVFTRRDLIEAHNLRFYEGVIYEDNLYKFQLMAFAGRVAVMNEPLYYRRNRAGSITASPDHIKRHCSLCVVISEIESFTEKHRNIVGQTGDRLIRYLLSVMGEYLAVMPSKMLDSPEIESFSRELRRIMRKHDCCGLLSLRAFCLGNEVYKIYRRSVSVAKRLLRVEKYEG